MNRLIFLREKAMCWRSASAFTGDSDDELWILRAGEPVVLTGEQSDEHVYLRVLCHRGIGWIFHAYID